MLPRGAEIGAKWALIPTGIDVLITHGPPEGILDRNRMGEPCGCRDLLTQVLDVKPRLHVFGHIHEGAGRTAFDGTTFLKASTQMGRGSGVLVELT
jgi:Icc-related predicted phosphoesterase